MRAGVIVRSAGDDVDDLLRTLWTVGSQDTPHWQLLVVAPQRAAGQIAARIAAYGWPSPYRAQVVPVPDGTDEAHAVAAGFAELAAPWVLVLAAGDELVPHALRTLLDATAGGGTGGGVDLVYGDSLDPADLGPFRKPDYSPHYALGAPYLGRPVLHRTEAVEAVGGWDPAMANAAEWDLALRVAGAGGRVVHVPELLVRAAPHTPQRWDGATRDAAIAAVRAQLLRQGFAAQVRALDEPWRLEVRPQLRGEPAVSLVMPTAGQRGEVAGRDVELAVHAVSTLAERTTYPHWDLVCVLGDTEPDGLRERITAAAAGHPVRFVTAGGPFNFARSVNAGVLASDGEYVLLLNDDTEVVSGDWLARMLEWAQVPDVGAVGAKLLFADGRIQHAGVYIGAEGLPNHIHIFEPADGNTGYYGSLQLTIDRLAVTGACLLVRRATYLEVGGSCEDYPLNFNDVDFCLKLHCRGLHSVLVPDARLLHFESSTRTPMLADRETALYRRQWQRFDVDPYVVIDRSAPD